MDNKFITPEIVGEPPDLAGLVCQGLIAEGFVCEGEIVTDTNVLYLQFADRWHRMVIDSGVIFWRPQNTPPKPWAVEEEGWVYPHFDLGVAAGLVGQRLTHYKMEADTVRCSICFEFAHGPMLLVEGVNDSVSHRVI
jgi:hypothetical protein